MRGLRRNWLYREAIADLVPTAALARPEYRFATPYDSWLSGSLGEKVEALYSRGSDLAELVDPGVVDDVCQEHRRGRFDRKRLLYCLLEFAQWHRSFVTGEERGESPEMGTSDAELNFDEFPVDSPTMTLGANK